MPQPKRDAHLWVGASKHHVFSKMLRLSPKQVATVERRCDAPIELVPLMQRAEILFPAVVRQVRRNEAKRSKEARESESLLSGQAEEVEMCAVPQPVQIIPSVPDNWEDLCEETPADPEPCTGVSNNYSGCQLVEPTSRGLLPSEVYADYSMALFAEDQEQQQMDDYSDRVRPGQKTAAMREWDQIKLEITAYQLLEAGCRDPWVTNLVAAKGLPLWYKLELEEEAAALEAVVEGDYPAPAGDYGDTVSVVSLVSGEVPDDDDTDFSKFYSHNPYELLEVDELEPVGDGTFFIHSWKRHPKKAVAYRPARPRVHLVEPPPKEPVPKAKCEVKPRVYKDTPWPNVREKRYLKPHPLQRQRIAHLAMLLYARGDMGRLRQLLLAAPSHGVFLSVHQDGYLGPNPWCSGSDSYFPLSSRPWRLLDPDRQLKCGDNVDGRGVTHRWGDWVILEAYEMPAPFERAAPRGRSRSRQRPAQAGPVAPATTVVVTPTPPPVPPRRNVPPPPSGGRVRPPIPGRVAPGRQPGGPRPVKQRGRSRSRRRPARSSVNTNYDYGGFTLKNYDPSKGRPANEGRGYLAQIFRWGMMYILTPHKLLLPDPREKSRNLGPLIDEPLGWCRDLLGHVPFIGAPLEAMAGAFCVFVRAGEDAVNACTRPLGFTIFLLALLSIVAPADAIRRCKHEDGSYHLSSACSPEDVWWMTHNTAYHKFGCVPCVNGVCWVLTGRGTSMAPGNTTRVYNPWLDVLFSVYMACKLTDWGEACFPFLVVADYAHRAGWLGGRTNCSCDCNTYLDYPITRTDLTTFQFAEFADWTGVATWVALAKDVILGAIRILTEVHPMIWVCLVYAALEKDIWVVLAMCTMVQVAEGGLMRLPPPTAEFPPGLLEGVYNGTTTVEGYPDWIKVRNNSCSCTWWSGGYIEGNLCPDKIAITHNAGPEGQIFCVSTMLLLMTKNYSVSTMVDLTGVPSAICGVYNASAPHCKVELSCIHDKRSWRCGKQVGWSPLLSHEDCGIGPWITGSVWVARSSPYYTTIGGVKLPINVSTCATPFCEIPSELGWLPIAGLPVPTNWSYFVGAAGNGLLTFLRDRSEQYFLNSQVLGRGPWLVHSYVLAIFGYSMGARWSCVGYLLFVTFIAETTATVPIRTTAVMAAGLLGSTCSWQGYVAAFLLICISRNRWAWVPAYAAKVLAGLPVFATMVTLVALTGPKNMVAGLEVCLNIHVEAITVEGWTTASFIFFGVIGLRVWSETSHGRYMAQVVYFHVKEAHTFLYCVAWEIGRYLDTDRASVLLLVSSCIWPALTVLVVGIYGALLLTADLVYMATQVTFRYRPAGVPRWLCPILNVGVRIQAFKAKCQEIAIILSARHHRGLAPPLQAHLEQIGSVSGTAAFMSMWVGRRGRYCKRFLPREETLCWEECNDCSLTASEEPAPGVLRTLISCMSGRQHDQIKGSVVELATPMSRSMGAVVGGALYTTHHGSRGRPLATPTGPAKPLAVHSAADIVVYPRPWGASSLSLCLCPSPEMMFLFTKQGRYLPFKPVSSNVGSLLEPVHLSELKGSSGAPILCPAGDVVGIFLAAQHYHGVASNIRWATIQGMHSQEATIATRSATFDENNLPPITNEGGVFPLHAPTGSGKSTRIPNEYVKRGLKVLVLVPNVAAVRALGPYVAEKYGTNPSIYAAGERLMRNNKLVYSTYGMYCSSLYRNTDSYDVIFLDECHSSDPTTVLGIGLALSTYQVGCRRTYILATATPPGYVLRPHPDIEERQLDKTGSIKFYGKTLDPAEMAGKRVCIFVPSKKGCEELATSLKLHGIKAVPYYRGKSLGDIPTEGPVAVVATDALCSGYNGNFDIVYDSNVVCSVNANLDYAPTFSITVDVAQAASDVRAQRRGRTGRGKRGLYRFVSTNTAPITSLDLADMIACFDSGIAWFGMSPASIATYLEVYRTTPGLRAMDGDVNVWKTIFTSIEGIAHCREVNSAKKANLPFPLLMGAQANVCHTLNMQLPDLSENWKPFLPEGPRDTGCPYLFTYALDTQKMRPLKPSKLASHWVRILSEEAPMSLVLGVVAAGTLFAVLMQAAERLSSMAVSKSWVLSTTRSRPVCYDHLRDPTVIDHMEPCMSIFSEEISQKAIEWAAYVQSKIGAIAAGGVQAAPTYMDKVTAFLQTEGLAVWPVAALGAGLIVSSVNPVLASLAATVAGLYTTTSPPVTVGISMGASLLASLHATPPQAMLLGGGFLAGVALRTFGMSSFLFSLGTGAGAATSAASLAYNFTLGRPLDTSLVNVCALALSPGAACVGALLGFLLARATTNDSSVWTNRLLAMLHKSSVLPEGFFIEGKTDGDKIGELLQRLRPWDVFLALNESLGGETQCAGVWGTLMAIMEALLRFLYNKIEALADKIAVRLPYMSCQSPTTMIGDGSITTTCSCGSEVSALVADGRILTKRAALTCTFYWNAGLPFNSTTVVVGSLRPLGQPSSKPCMYALGFQDWVELAMIEPGYFLVTGTTVLTMNVKDLIRASKRPAAACGTEILTTAMRRVPTLTRAGIVRVGRDDFMLGAAVVSVKLENIYPNLEEAHRDIIRRQAALDMIESGNGKKFVDLAPQDMWAINYLEMLERMQIQNPQCRLYVWDTEAAEAAARKRWEGAPLDPKNPFIETDRPDSPAPPGGGEPTDGPQRVSRTPSLPSVAESTEIDISDSESEAVNEEVDGLAKAAAELFAAKVALASATAPAQVEETMASPKSPPPAPALPPDTVSQDTTSTTLEMEPLLAKVPSPTNSIPGGELSAEDLEMIALIDALAPSPSELKEAGVDSMLGKTIVLGEGQDLSKFEAYFQEDVVKPLHDKLEAASVSRSSPPPAKVASPAPVQEEEGIWITDADLLADDLPFHPVSTAPKPVLPGFGEGVDPPIRHPEGPPPPEPPLVKEQREEPAETIHHVLNVDGKTYYWEAAPLDWQACARQLGWIPSSAAPEIVVHPPMDLNVQTRLKSTYPLALHLLDLTQTESKSLAWERFSVTKHAMGCIATKHTWERFLKREKVTLADADREACAADVAPMATKVVRKVVGKTTAQITDPNGAVNWASLGIQHDPHASLSIVVTPHLTVGDVNRWLGARVYFVLIPRDRDSLSQALALREKDQAVFNTSPAALRLLSLVALTRRLPRPREIAAMLREIPAEDCSQVNPAFEEDATFCGGMAWDRCSASYTWFGTPIVTRKTRPMFSPVARTTSAVSKNKCMLFYTTPDTAVERLKKVTIEREARPGGASYHKMVELAKQRASKHRNGPLPLEEACKLVKSRTAKSRISGLTGADVRQCNKRTRECVAQAQQWLREGNSEALACTLSPKQELFVRRPEKDFAVKAARFICYPPLEVRVLEKMILGKVGPQVVKDVLGDAYGFQYTPQEDTIRKVTAWKSCKNPMILTTDAIAFDSQITPEDVAVECEIYKAGAHPSLHEDIEHLHSHLYSGGILLNESGESIGTRHCRASGVYTTSSSNCLTAWLKVSAACMDAGIRPVCLTICGDDVSIITESSGDPGKDQARAGILQNRLNNLGLRGEGVGIAYSLSDSETCSHYITSVNQGGREAFIKARDPLLPLGRISAETTQSNPMSRWLGNLVSYYPTIWGSRVLATVMMDIAVRTGVTEATFTYRGNDYTIPLSVLPGVIASLHGRAVFQTTNHTPDEISKTAWALHALGARPLSSWRRHAKHVLWQCRKAGGVYREVATWLLGWSEDILPVYTAPTSRVHQWISSTEPWSGLEGDFHVVALKQAQVQAIRMLVKGVVACLAAIALCTAVLV
uniref:Genome polyprotein n=1 Tax=Yili teratoscincus roborowskii hepacivirus TaxID=2116371 RepID=A0A2P1GMN7_9FLAV|nr:polyprotein [Yili teratoscincus roborowskii hepacivirus]